MHTLITQNNIIRIELQICADHNLTIKMNIDTKVMSEWIVEQTDKWVDEWESKTKRTVDEWMT